MGAGQVTVAGDYAYVGHITSKEGLGTTILGECRIDNPRVVSAIMLDDPTAREATRRGSRAIC